MQSLFAHLHSIRPTFYNCVSILGAVNRLLEISSDTLAVENVFVCEFREEWPVPNSQSWWWDWSPTRSSRGKNICSIHSTFPSVRVGDDWWLMEVMYAGALRWSTNNLYTQALSISLIFYLFRNRKSAENWHHSKNCKSDGINAQRVWNH